MNTFQRTPEQRDRYAGLLVAWAGELVEKLGQPAPSMMRNVDLKDRPAFEDAASEAYKVLDDVRSRLWGDGLDPVAWRTMKVDDGRDGNEILEGLENLIYEFSRPNGID